MLIQPLTPEIREKRRALRRKLLGVPGRMWRSPFARRARRGLLWMLVVGFFVHSGFNIYGSVLLNRELADVRQRGEPLRFSELAPPSVPEAQNAALVYAQATRALRFSGEENIAINTPPSRRTPHQEQIIEPSIARNRSALDLAQRAAGMPRCQFPVNYQTKNPFTLTFPYYAKMRELARFLKARAEIQAKNGDSQAALRDVRAVFGMAHHLSNEPVLIGFLVAQAVDSLANQALARVLESAPISLEQAAAFEKSLPPTDWNRAFKRCLTGERAWGIFGFDMTRGSLQAMMEINAISGGGTVEPNEPYQGPPAWVAYPLLWLWRPISKFDEVQNLRLWRKQLDAAANPRLNFSNSGQRFDQAIKELPGYAVLTSILMPVFSRAGDNRDRAIVRQLEREVALALSIYRAAKGNYPTHISQVDPLSGNSLPFDPYSQKPFVYRAGKNGDTFTLYSIGPNRKDDGGKDWTSPHAPGDWVQGDDIVWGAQKR